MIVVKFIEKDSDVEETQQGECEDSHDDDKIVLCKLKIDKNVPPYD